MNSIINYATTYKPLLAGNKLALCRMFSPNRDPEYQELNAIRESGSRRSRFLRYRSNLSLIIGGQQSILKLLKWSLSESACCTSAPSSRRAGVSMWPWPASFSPVFRARFPCSGPKIVDQILKPVLRQTLGESRCTGLFHPYVKTG